MYKENLYKVKSHNPLQRAPQSTKEKPSQDTTLTRHEICDQLMYLLHVTTLKLFQHFITRLGSSLNLLQGVKLLTVMNSLQDGNKKSAQLNQESVDMNFTTQ